MTTFDEWNAQHQAEDAAREQEIDRLTDEVGTIENTLRLCVETVEAQEREIADLKAEIERLTQPDPVTDPLFGFWTPPANFANAASKLGAPQVYRHFPGASLPARFPGNGADKGIPVVVSFKYQPKDVLAGRHDSAILAYFNSVPDDQQMWWSYWHEPEDDIIRGGYTAADYRAAWTYLLNLIPKKPNLRSTLILMGYSITSTSRKLDDYAVPGLDVIAWDAYLSKVVPNINALLDKCVAASRSKGAGWGICEISVMSDNAGFQSRTAAMDYLVPALVDYAHEHEAEMVCWFEEDKSAHGGIETDWRMTAAAAARWKSMTQKG